MVSKYGVDEVFKVAVDLEEAGLLAFPEVESSRHLVSYQRAPAAKHNALEAELPPVHTKPTVSGRIGFGAQR